METCDAALHAALAVCKTDDEACLNKHGVYSSSSSKECGGGTVTTTTPCMLAGSSQTYHVCLTTASTVPQVVYGRPQFGGPSKVETAE